MMNTAIFSKLHVRRRGLRLLLTGLLMCVVPVFGVARANAVSITQYPLPNSLSLESPDFISAQPSGVFTAGATASSAFARLQPTPTGVTLLAGPPGPRAQRGMTAGPDGSLWYLSSQVISNRNYEAIVQATATGTAVRAVYPSTQNAPVDMVLGSDGALWLTDAGTDEIDRYVPGGEITSFPAPRGPLYLTAGPDGALWFTESWPAIGRINSDGELSEFELPPGTGPSGIVLGPDGALWFAASQAGAIGRLTTSGELSEFAVARPSAGPSSSAPTPMALAVGPEGAIWFTDPGDDSVGRVSGGTVSEYPIPLCPPRCRYSPVSPLRPPKRSPPAPMARCGSPRRAPRQSHG